MSVRTRFTRGAVTRAMAVAAAVIALTLSTAGCSGDPVMANLQPLAPQQHLPADTQAQLKKAVTDAMTATGSSGAIVGVWAPWSGSWVQALGTVAVGSETAVTADMTFRAGGVTRAMTCDVLYRLAAAGTVKLDDGVTSYVGGMPGFGDVTLLDLCEGTSGIGSYGVILDRQMRGNPGRVWDPRELVGYGVGQVGGEVHPGSAFRDSDAGYLLLGLALQGATGKTAAQLLHSYVFAPLGMTESALPADAPADPVVGSSTPLRGFFLEAKAKSGAYECTKQTEITEQSASYGFTNAGVVSDIDDLGRYASSLAKGTLVTQKNRFAEPLPVTAKSPSWLTTSGGAVQAGPLVGQYGSAPGYLTAVFSDPGSGLTVAAVLNDSTAGRNAIFNLALELAAIGSKTPATGSRQAPAVGLPWTAKQYHDAIAKAAVACAPEPK
ncbi:serine hydrolase domain-containing protein [Microbacterium kribbense]|uniref:Serine hydrolase domain-containing protein n=1 Tax=Microbacterium kribbense TaxID=433645 RepID=A0ABP7G5F7_9MICO